ncbi:MAG: hypothetical protein KDA33_07535, partial [Phycisphaerales bacterium]|nr:hypothetical protein [Phycisphaerales bacterium]
MQSACKDYSYELFEFHVHHEDPQTHARTGTFSTPHGAIQTPVFMPVGTRGSV